MNRVLLLLDILTICLSFLGLALPVRTPLRFLFPHLEASISGLVLTTGVVIAQLRNYALKKLASTWLVIIGVVLVALTVERLFVSTNSGIINSRLSHADLFLFAPLAISYLLTALDRSAIETVQASFSSAFMAARPHQSDDQRRTRHIPHIRPLIHK
ncbi:MAG TPA: hypothetical protein VFN56_01465 [Candidatus Saccharimonadales bacterium]|nr:hypothetical protein [Candidatus Saccharimonadales bacterium]